MKLLSTLLLTTIAWAADATGKWTASFETQIGTQTYTYQFKVEGQRLTGTATNAGKTFQLHEGRVQGDTLTFVENFEYQGQEIRIEYSGKLTSDDEIQFTRKVAEFAVEDFVAKRAK
jgi:hypothetical protein